MDIHDWAVCVIEPNRFEAQIVTDLLRFSGARNYRAVHDSAEALDLLKLYPATIILMEMDSQPIDGLAFTRRLRRDADLKSREAPIFLTTKTMSRAVAEACRIAGANALIGKPVSGTTLISTIRKVLANPRPFVEGDNYVGPCRRAGIVTARAPLRRRISDEHLDIGESPKVGEAVQALRAAVDDLVTSQHPRPAACEAALSDVQTFAVAFGDGQLTRACAAFSLLLSECEKIDGAKRIALGRCMEGVAKLSVAADDTPARDAIAEAVRESVAGLIGARRAA